MLDRHHTRRPLRPVLVGSAHETQETTLKAHFLLKMQDLETESTCSSGTAAGATAVVGTSLLPALDSAAVGCHVALSCWGWLALGREPAGYCRAGNAQSPTRFPGPVAWPSRGQGGVRATTRVRARSRVRATTRVRARSRARATTRVRARSRVRAGAGAGAGARVSWPQRRAGPGPGQRRSSSAPSSHTPAQP